MMRYLMPLGIFVLLVLLLVTGLEHAQTKDIIVSPLLGKNAPAFTLPNLLQSGQTVSNAEFRHRWSLVNVWGTWCVECRAEHASLLQIHDESQVPIIGIDWKDDDAQARAWLDQLGDPYESVGADRDGRVAINWGVYGAPETFLISPAGKVVYKHVGPMSEAVWQTEFVPLIAAVPAAGGARAGTGS
jgi:cytochrome c biogenesis protein CcmG, thiol:disulfide interchange protein DsbE